MKSAAILTAAMILLVACGGGPARVGSMLLGSDADRLGNITQTGLDYTFKKPANNRKAADLINSIYFQGDCIHFSFTLNRPAPSDKVSVTFSAPGGEQSMPAERLEVRRNTVLGITSSFMVYGFSLVGSILERFHKNELEGPPPADGYCCRDMPFEITLEIDDEQGSLRETMKSAFRIRYE